MSDLETVAVGDVVQITDETRKGWRGAFVLVTEVKSFGVQGFVHCVESHDEASRAFIRLKREDFEMVGRAVMVPADVAEGVEE